MSTFDSMNSFLSRIEVHTSSHNLPEDVRAALWRSLNTCESLDFLDITEDS